MSRRRLASVSAALVLLASVAFATTGPALAATTASRPQVSFTQAQQYFMCTVCGEALNVARSPEAFNENAELRRLIKRGDTVDQIKAGMVDQYGEAVLADPPKHGFASLLVIIPAAVVVTGLLVLGFTIPRWRRRASAQANEPISTAPPLSETDAERLDADLARQP